ncbi:MAG: bacillithiol biosynthesis protein BshC, partial [Pyrinomonadaceae bacterium]
MSATESACYSTPEDSGLRVETLPFERVPHQTRLFLDYLRDPIALRRFYPSAIRFHHELPSRAPEVLAAQKTDRQVLCGALKETNANWGAGAETLANIELLRDADSLAVVSGQQVGLFTGPLYTIYKALSAVKLAACLQQRGTKAVPVFWMATEDHDFPEVAKAEFIGRDCRLASVDVPFELHREGHPVGQVKLDQSITAVVDRVIELLPDSEFTDDLANLLRDSWKPGRDYGEAFVRMMTALLKGHGLIFLDPMQATLKKLAGPLYASAARHAQE